MRDSERREVEQAALRLLACREHSRAELRRKLRIWTADEGLLDGVLDVLETQHALSEQRFVQTYIESRKRKGFGPVRIRMELREKGVDSNLVSDWLDENDPDWDEVLIQAARRKFGSVPPSDFRERGKRARFLEYRGFSPERIRQFLQKNE